MIFGMSEMPSRGGAVPEFTLGWRLQRALDYAGKMKAEDMADEMGVHRATVSRWMNERGAPPRPIYLKQWALRTGVNRDWLTTGVAGTSPDGGTSRPRTDSNRRPSDYNVAVLPRAA